MHSNFWSRFTLWVHLSCYLNSIWGSNILIGWRYSEDDTVWLQNTVGTNYDTTWRRKGFQNSTLLHQKIQKPTRLHTILLPDNIILQNLHIATIVPFRCKTEPCSRYHQLCSRTDPLTMHKISSDACTQKNPISRITLPNQLHAVSLAINRKAKETCSTLLQDSHNYNLQPI